MVQAAEECIQSFAFLVSEFGYRIISKAPEARGFAVGFGGDQVGVMVTFALRDPLATFVCLLDDGKLPGSPGEIRADTKIKRFHLEDIEALSGIEPPSQPVYGLPGKDQFDGEARRLRAVAATLLRGGLELVPALQQQVLDRAREFAVIKWGPHASDFGW
jgi:hypothetical protein